MKLTAADLVRAINRLPRDRRYNYVNPSNSGKIVIHRVIEPEGPIEIKRFNPTRDPNSRVDSAEIETISNQMLWRMANALVEGRPVNVDRVFGGSYNTRSVLEALLAHTPEFYFCKPGRVESIAGRTSTRAGHKHLLFLPAEPHENGVLIERKVDMVISELATGDAIYNQVDIGSVVSPQAAAQGLSIEDVRRHAQMQVALIRIGQQLGFRTYVAANDQHLKVEGVHIRDMDSVVQSLSSEQVLGSYASAQSAGRLIDCIWFRNGRLMPAVIEVEHSTGVRSGLDRMLTFHNTGPALRDIRWTIVAPDEDRSKVISICQEQQFRPLAPRFFSYSAVEELYSLVQRRKPLGITDEFLDCFMEETIVA
jgi:hypothetical protein